MKLTYQLSLLILAAISDPTALAQPVGAATPDDTTITISHNPDGTAVFPTNSSNTASDRTKAAQSNKCITFTADNQDWHYANTGVWGSASGTFRSTGGKICVPHNDAAGGAMYIGTGANPGPGSTKLEIFFPSSGNAFGDVSLVDGYSLSVKCTAGSTSIGGDKNLWKTGKPCRDTSLQGRGICKNDQGYAPNQSDVTAFFQEGLKGGNEFCIWKNCKAPGWPVGRDIKCHVSGGR